MLETTDREKIKVLKLEAAAAQAKIDAIKRLLAGETSVDKVPVVVQKSE
jgi:hypothetical protein